jgi:hypothetical protein
MNMIKRMAYMLGVIGSSGEKRSRLGTALQIALITAVVLLGFVLPLIWVPVMGLAFRKSGIQMGERATEFYAQSRTSEAGVTVRKAQTVRIGMSAGLIRMTLLILLPIAAALIALLTGAEIGGGQWLSALILLIAVSALATLAWFAYRRWRHRRRSAASSAAAPEAMSA